MKRCARCIMDDIVDPCITFDANGYCDYCTDALQELEKNNYYQKTKNEEAIKAIIKTIKEKSKKDKYDCVMGLSGGLDSSYLAYLGFKWGLRILAVHIDDSFDTEVSKENIKKLCEAANIKLITITPDSEQYFALTKAFMKASVPNIAMPQDNILFAYLYRYIKKNHIKYFLSGANFATECITTRGHSHSAYDVVNIKDISRKFNDRKINKLNFISLYKKYAYEKILGVKTIKPLNYVKYERETAFKELKDFCGFEYYGSKHLENKFTAFLQLYWLPKKFNSDKRISHLSSLIISNQITREEALAELDKDICDKKQIDEYISEIKNKLRISESEFDSIMSSEPREHNYYKTDKFAEFVRKKMLGR